MTLRTVLRKWIALSGASSVGSGVQVLGPVSVETFGRLVIGNDVQLGGAAGRAHLVTSRGATLEIGDRSRLGHGSGISSSHSVVIGRDVHIGPFCLLMDSDFHTVGAHKTASESTAIRLDDGVHLGAHVVVLRGSHVGAGTRVLAGSVVSGNVPANSVVSGVPARPVMPESIHDVHDSRRDVGSTVRELMTRTFGASNMPDGNDFELEQIEGWNSLGVLNLMLSLEEKFDISISPEGFSQLATLADVQQLIGTALDLRTEAHG